MTTTMKIASSECSIESSGVTVRVERHTPMSARHLLESQRLLNIPRRNLRRRNVDLLRKEMIAGRFVFNGETVKIDGSGAVVDGNHRLEALAQCPEGVSVELLVVRGLPTESVFTVDAGAIRNRTDALQMDGAIRSHARVISVAINRILTWHHGFWFLSHTGGSHGNFKATNQQVVWYHRRWEARWNRVLEVVPANPTMTSHGDAATLAFLVLDDPLGQVREFLEQIETGARLEPGDPVLAFRNWRIRQQKIRQGPYQEGRLSGLFRAYNAWRSDEKLKVLKPTRSNWAPWNLDWVHPQVMDEHDNWEERSA